MRPSVFLFTSLLSLSGAQASWFGSATPQYTEWSNSELKQWLKEHHIASPSIDNYSHEQLRELVKSNWNSASAWTYDQYTNAQKSFADVRDSTFDTWDESRLREFLLEQGVVAPKGPREQLVLLAKSKYRAYTDAASSFSAQASTALYGDSTHQMSKTLSSVAAQATKEAGRALDDSKDYVYSTWDDNKLKEYLEEHGVIKTKTEKKRDELLAMMRDAYAKVTDPIWKAWSTSYTHEWLVSHGLIKSDSEKKRDVLQAKMVLYYYNINDSVWSTWSDSDLKAWLVERGIVKSDAQLNRDKLVKHVRDNYVNALDTFWGAWADSQMRQWLIDNGYMRTDAQVKRDELVKLFNDKYTDASARTAAYLIWPDARLRAYLRERGVSEDKLPTSRPGLLQETRIRWIQVRPRAEALYMRIREVVNEGVEAAEEKLGRVLEILSGGYEEAGEKVKEGKEKSGEKVKVGEDKVKQAGKKLEGEL